MNAYLIMLLVACIIYWAYTIAVFSVFGIPESYSNTFYLFNEKVKGLGWLFPAMCLCVVGLVLPGWLDLTDTINTNMAPLAFFSGAGLLFVAAAPFFKEMTRDTGRPLMDLVYRSFHGQGLVHTLGALSAMIGTVTWVALTKLWWMIFVILGITCIIMFATRTAKKSITFWGEFFIFNMIFIVLGILHIYYML